MAEKSGKGDEGTSRSSKLDSYSKEDLIKYVKKQAITLQRTRTKCDELSNQLLQHKSESASSDTSLDGSNDERVQILEQQLLDLGSQKDDLFQKLNSSLGQIQSLQEQMDCMRMKDETLTSSLQCMHEEHVRLNNENKALQNQVLVLADARDGALEHVKLRNTRPDDISVQELEQEKDDLSKQLTIQKSRYESAAQSLEESSDQFMKLTRELEESKRTEEMKSTELSKFTELYEKLKERHQTESQDFNELYETMKDEKDHLTLMVQRLKVERSEIEVEKEKLSMQLEQREGDVTALKVDFASMMKNMDLLKQQAASDEEKKNDMISKWEDALASVDGFKSRVSDLETLVEKLTGQCHDYEQLKEMSSSSSASIDALKSEVIQLHADVEQVRRERDELVGTRESYVAEIDELKEEKEMLKHETQIAQEESQKFEEMIGKLESDKNNMLNQLEMISQQQVNIRDTVIEILRQYYEKTQAAKDEVAELEDDTVENNLQLIRNIVNQLFMEKEKVTKDNLEMCAAKNDEFESLQRSFTKKQDDSEAAESEKESLSVINQLLQEKESDLKEEIGILKIEVDKLEMENQDLASKLASFGDLTEISNLKQNIVSSTEKNEELEKELKEEAEKAAFMQKDLIEQRQYAIELEEKIMQMSDGMAKMRHKSDLPSDEVKTEITDYKKQIDDLTNQVKILQEKLSESDTSRHEKIETTQQEYALLKTEYDALIAEMEVSKENFEKCENEKSDMEKTVDDLSKEKTALEETINEKSKLYESQNIETKELQDRHNVLIEESESMKNTINDLELKLADLKSISDKFECSAVEMKKMEDSLGDMVTKLESKETEKLCLNEEMEKLQRIVEALQADLGNVNGEKQSLVVQLNELGIKLSESDNALQDAVNESQQEKMRLQTDLSAANTEIETLKATASSVVSEREAQEMATSDRVEQLESEKAEMQKEYDTVKSQIVEKDEKISQLEDEICNLNEINQKVSDALENVSSEKGALIKSTDELVTKIQFEKDSVEKSLQDVSVKLEEKDCEVKVFDEQNKTLTEQLAHAQKASGVNLENELENYKSNSEQLKEENDSLKMHLELKGNEKETLQKECESLKREKDSLNKKMEMTSEKGDNMVVVVEELKNRIAQKDSLLAEMEHSTQDEIEDLQNALRDRKDVVSKVTKENSDFSMMLQELEEKNIEINREKDELTSDVQRLKESIQEMTTLMSARNDGVDQVTLENVNLKENISISFQRESELQNKLEILARDKTNFTNILSSLKNVLTRISTEIGKNDIESRFPSSESESDDWSVAQWSSFCIRYLESFSVVSQEMVTVKEALHSIKAENVHLRAQLDDVKRDVDKHQQQADQVSSEELFAIQKRLRDKEELCTKLKMLAVKSKKEAAELRSQKENLTRQLDSLKQDYADAVIHTADDPSAHEQIEKQRSEIERLEKSLEEITADLWQNQRDLDVAARELTSIRQQHVELKDQKESLNKQIEQLDNEKKSLETRLSAQDLEQSSLRIQLEELQKEKAQIQTKVAEKESLIGEIKEEHSQSQQELQKALESTQQELEHAKHGAKQSSMMGLEIDDYERTLENLNTRLADKDSILAERDAEITRLNERASQLQKEIAAVESQRVQSDERGNRLKQLLVKTKKDLAESKKMESEQRSSDAHLRGKLEHFNQQSEEYKVQLSSLTSEKQKLQDHVRTMSESHQRTVRSLENRIQSLVGDLEISQSELHSIQSEYESYKVRVHSVLKQQRSKSTSEVNVELEKADRERLENALEHLKIKLQATNESLSAVKQENELLQADHDRLLHRHNNHLHDSQDKEATMKSRLDELSHEKFISHSEQAEVVKQLTLQNEALTNSFKSQIRHLQDEHQKALSLLQHQIEMAEDENYRLHQELSQQQSIASQPKLLKAITISATEKHLIEPLHLNIDMKHEERQSGEGMEHTEIDLSSPITPVKSNTSILSFEQLLSQPLQDDQLSISSQMSLVDVDILKQNMLTAEKKIQHLTEVLSESESTAMRLTEQAMVLKDEIRRLEGNRQRDEEMHNLEYLKNIMLKFLTLKSGDERVQLIPVITTMLKLSSDEKGLLNAVAEDDPSAAVQNSAGWGTYLHRWTSLS